MDEKKARAQRLTAARKVKFPTPTAAADAFGWNKNTYLSHENGNRPLTWEAAERYGKAFGRHFYYLMTGKEPPDEKVTRGPSEKHTSNGRQTAPNGVSSDIKEVDVRGGAGGGGISSKEIRVSDQRGNIFSGDALRGRWTLPDEYMLRELHVAPETAYIIEVQGDSMSPTLDSGDRVMVDTRQRRPSPPGIFALWDGLGVVIKRVEYVSGSEPATLQIISDNPLHRPYQRTLDETNIVGRVVWRAQRL